MTDGVERRLVVYVPPLGGRDKRWQRLIEHLGNSYDLSNTDFETWPTHAGDKIKLFSMGRDPLTKRAIRLNDEIQAWCTQADRQKAPYSEIVLVGSSMGGLLARHALLLADGAYSDTERNPWATLVRRVVLFASLNRGWDPKRLGFLGRLGAILLGWLPLAIRHAMKGSAYVTDLRIAWIRRMAAKGASAPDVVVLIGGRDELTDREDSFDVEQFRNATYIKVVGAHHGDIIDVDSAPNPDARLADFGQALFGPPNGAPLAESTGPKSVVFVLHGIRAGRYKWVSAVEETLTRGHSDVEVVAPEYGFFSALAFAFPPTRGKNVRFLLDQYSYYLAKNRSATFHFIGHSNGTYLLGEALRRVPSMQFGRVYLAGSVLPRNYPWRLRFDRRQVAAVRNDRGAKDLPVAVLCSGLRGMGMRDIGTGGFDGFAELDNRGIQWGRHFPGGHGAALSGPERIEDVVNYTVTGQASEPLGLVEPSSGLRLFSRLAMVLVPLAIIGLIAGLVVFSVKVGVLAGIAVALFLILGFALA